MAKIMNEWKAIDTAPEETPVLVFFKNGTMEVARHYAERGWWTNDNLDFGYGFDNPIAWQPLPEPPVAEHMLEKEQK